MKLFDHQTIQHFYHNNISNIQQQKKFIFDYVFDKFEDNTILFDKYIRQLIKEAYQLAIQNIFIFYETMNQTKIRQILGINTSSRNSTSLFSNIHVFI